jgi:hypothetical protein
MLMLLFPPLQCIIGLSDGVSPEFIEGTAVTAPAATAEMVGSASISEEAMASSLDADDVAASDGIVFSMRTLSVTTSVVILPGITFTSLESPAKKDPSGMEVVRGSLPTSSNRRYMRSSVGLPCLVTSRCLASSTVTFCCANVTD